MKHISVEASWDKSDPSNWEFFGLIFHESGRMAPRFIKIDRLIFERQDDTTWERYDEVGEI